MISANTLYITNLLLKVSILNLTMYTALTLPWKPQQEYCMFGGDYFQQFILFELKLNMMLLFKMEQFLVMMSMYMLELLPLVRNMMCLTYVELRMSLYLI